MNLEANFPAGAPLDAQGRLTPEWRMFFLSLFNRGGGSSGVDVSALETLVNAQGVEIAELFLLENSNATGALLCTLMARVAVLEMALQGVVPIATPAAGALPEPMAIAARAVTQLPEPVPVAPRAPDDLRKLIEA